MSTLNKYINQALMYSDNKNCENINWSQEKQLKKNCLLLNWVLRNNLNLITLKNYPSLNPDETSRSYDINKSPP